MPDITMCTNNQCPNAEICYRSTATPNEHRQAYCFFQCEHDDGIHIICQYFIENYIPISKTTKA